MSVGVVYMSCLHDRCLVLTRNSTTHTWTRVGVVLQILGMKNDNLAKSGDEWLASLGHDINNAFFEACAGRVCRECGASNPAHVVQSHVRKWVRQ
jgi:hypothetical protein